MGERLINGLFKENPTFVLLLGMCPTLAVTTSAKNGLGMGLTTLVVLALSNLIISALRKVIPDKIRIPAFIVIIASFVTMVELLLKAYIPTLFDALGIYIPLIVVNCIILGRAEAYAYHNGVVESLFDGIGMGLGFSFALTLIGGFRELLGTGMIFDISVMPDSFVPVNIFVMAPGAFFVLALLTAIQNFIKDIGTRKGKDMSKIQSGCGHDCMNCSIECSDRKAPEDKTKAEAKAEAEVKPEAAPEVKVEAEESATPEAKPETAPESEAVAENVATPETMPEAAPETAAAPEVKPAEKKESKKLFGFWKNKKTEQTKENAEKPNEAEKTLETAATEEQAKTEAESETTPNIAAVPETETAPAVASEEPLEAEVEPEPEAAPEPVAEPESEVTPAPATAPEPEPETAPEAAPEPETASEAAPETETAPRPEPTVSEENVSEVIVVEDESGDLEFFEIEDLKEQALKKKKQKPFKKKSMDKARLMLSKAEETIKEGEDND